MGKLNGPEGHSGLAAAANSGAGVSVAFSRFVVVLLVLFVCF
jgi:hypothetical protein